MKKLTALILLLLAIGTAAFAELTIISNNIYEFKIDDIYQFEGVLCGEIDGTTTAYILIEAKVVNNLIVYGERAVVFAQRPNYSTVSYGLIATLDKQPKYEVDLIMLNRLASVCSSFATGRTYSITVKQ